MYEWKVCPIQGRQLKDVRKEDLYGDFRICNTYRGGGGYDKFPVIAKKRYNIFWYETLENIHNQFIVQLYGCHLDCPYCYVTADGVRGEYIKYNSPKLINNFKKAQAKRNVGVFHLMGGSPALYIEHWSELIDLLFPYNGFWNSALFTSDLLLTEKYYDPDIIEKINNPSAMYAVNIKGTNDRNYYENTRKQIDWNLFWTNLETIYDTGLNFYITFTNPDNDLEDFKSEIKHRFNDRPGPYGKPYDILKDSFVINLNWDYEALKESDK